MEAYLNLCLKLSLYYIKNFKAITAINTVLSYLANVLIFSGNLFSVQINYVAHNRQYRSIQLCIAIHTGMLYLRSTEILRRYSFHERNTTYKFLENMLVHFTYPSMRKCTQYLTSLVVKSNTS